MKKICFINGSPKTGESCSLYMIDYISNKLGNAYEEKMVINALQLFKNSNQENILKEILSCEAIVVVFPLYIDSLPSSLLEVLEALDICKKSLPTDVHNIPCLYGLVNCGFIEGHQNINALKILENYAKAVSFKWCGGIGLGGGEMIRSTKNQIPLQSKPALPIYHALRSLADGIKELKVINSDKAIVFANHRFPKWFFIFMANRTWVTWAKRNGIKKNRMFAKPYLD